MSENQYEGITLVPEPSRQLLNPRQTVDYRSQREEFLKWLFHFGKDPDRAEGYAYDTVRRRASDVAVFHRFCWTERYDGYTLDVTHDDTDAYCKQLVYEDYSDDHRANVQKSLNCYWRWRGDGWDPQITFSGSDNTRRPRDYLTRAERQSVREAALEYGTVPHYNSLTPEERAEWKQHLARRYRKPADEITREDFERANGFKIPSLIFTMLDAALRPAEVGRARVGWVDTDNAVLRIPEDQSTKARDNWVVPVRDRTARVLGQWIDERELYDRYRGNDRLWLTRESQPYSSRSLKYVLTKLCELADIDTENRQITAYAVRHSTGTYVAREEGLEAAAAQLRHKSVTTTRKYDQTPTDELREALDQL